MKYEAHLKVKFSNSQEIVLVCKQKINMLIIKELHLN